MQVPLKPLFIEPPLPHTFERLHLSLHKGLLHRHPLPLLDALHTNIIQHHFPFHKLLVELAMGTYSAPYTRFGTTATAAACLLHQGSVCTGACCLEGVEGLQCCITCLLGGWGGVVGVIVWGCGGVYMSIYACVFAAPHRNLPTTQLSVTHTFGVQPTSKHPLFPTTPLPHAQNSNPP